MGGCPRTPLRLLRCIHRMRGQNTTLASMKNCKVDFLGNSKVAFFYTPCIWQPSCIVISNASADNNEGDQPPAKKVKKSLAKLLGQVKKPSDPGNATTPADRIDLEMSRYVSAPGIELGADPLQWWSMHAAAYPSLAKLARKYLCICGTSSASE